MINHYTHKTLTFNNEREEMNNKLKNWEEDYALENGQYLNKCMDCGEQFIGHKRRIQCKECANQMNDKLKELKKLLSELYQVLGVLDAPINVLDQVIAGASGKPLPYETLLPFNIATCNLTIEQNENK